MVCVVLDAHHSGHTPQRMHTTAGGLLTGALLPCGTRPG